MTTLLDTRVVPPSDRPDYWSAGIAEHFFPMRVEPVGRAPVRGTAHRRRGRPRRGALDRRRAAPRRADHAG